MQLKILSKRIPLITVLSGLVLFVALFLYFFPKNPSQGESALVVESPTVLSNQIQSSSSQEQAGIGLPASPVGRPARLTIPSINVDAAVEYVGLTSDGAMDVPKGPGEVAWFRLGQLPGKNGTAVIAGHSGWGNGIQAVFDNLHQLQQGDKLYIEDENGMIITFVVRESRTYDPTADAAGVFGSSDGKTHLNLITCVGEWNDIQQSYSDRLVVFTDKEIE